MSSFSSRSPVPGSSCPLPPLSPLLSLTSPRFEPHPLSSLSSPLAHQSRVRAPPWEAASWEGGRDAGGHGHHVRRVGGSGKSVSQSAGRPARPSVSQSVSQSVRQSARQSVSQSVGRSVGRSVSQPVSHPVSQSIGQSIVMHEGLGHHVRRVGAQVHTMVAAYMHAY